MPVLRIEADPRWPRLLVVLALLSLALGCGEAVVDRQDAQDVQENQVDVTLEGSFVWALENGDRTGPLTAIFTPGASDQWSVQFDFVWEDVSHTYSGTASGSLTSGALEGTAWDSSEGDDASLWFSGTFEDGTFRGTHGFLHEDGSREEAGALTLAHRD